MRSKAVRSVKAKEEIIELCLFPPDYSRSSLRLTVLTLTVP